MIHVTLNPKSTGAALAVLIAGLLSAASAKAQTLYFDPTMMGGDTGGSGTFDMTTSDFYNGTTDQPFTAGATAEFDGSGGTVTVSGVVDPAAIGFDATGAYTVGADSTGTIAEGTSTSLNITNGGSSSATVSAPITFTGSGGNGNNDNGLISVNLANTGSGSLVFGSTVTNTPETVAQGGTGLPQFFQVDATQGTVEFDGNILGANTGYDPGSGSSTNDNINVKGGATVLLDNGNFDRFQDSGTLLTNVAGVTIAATNSFVSGGILGGGSAGTTTYSGQIAHFGGTETLTAAAGGRVNFSNDLYAGGLGAGNNLVIQGAGIIAFTYANGNDYATQYNNAGNDSAVGTEIANGTLLADNAGGSATGGGFNQNSNSTAAFGSNNVVQIDNVTAPTAAAPVAVLGGTGYVLQQVVAIGANSSVTPGDISAAGVVTPGTLHLYNGLTASNGLTGNFTLTSTPSTSSMVALARTTTNPENGNVTNGAPTYALTLSGPITINLSGTINTADTYTLFYSTAGTPWDISGAAFTFNGVPTGFTADEMYVADDSATGDEEINVDFNANPVPEPSTWALMGIAGLVLIGSGKLRRLRA